MIFFRVSQKHVSREPTFQGKVGATGNGTYCGPGAGTGPELSKLGDGGTPAPGPRLAGI